VFGQRRRPIELCIKPRQRVLRTAAQSRVSISTSPWSEHSQVEPRTPRPSGNGPNIKGLTVRVGTLEPKTPEAASELASAVG
jgi:hypothetical protein